MARDSRLRTPSPRGCHGRAMPPRLREWEESPLGGPAERDLAEEDRLVWAERTLQEQFGDDWRRRWDIRQISPHCLPELGPGGMACMRCKCRLEDEIEVLDHLEGPAHLGVAVHLLCRRTGKVIWSGRAPSGDGERSGRQAPTTAPEAGVARQPPPPPGTPPPSAYRVPEFPGTPPIPVPGGFAPAHAPESSGLPALVRAYGPLWAAQHGITYTTAADWPDEPPGWIFCAWCKTKLPGYWQVAQHIEGRKHQWELERRAARRAPAAGSAPTRRP